MTIKIPDNLPWEADRTDILVPDRGEIGRTFGSLYGSGSENAAIIRARKGGE